MSRADRVREAADGVVAVLGQSAEWQLVARPLMDLHKQWIRNQDSFNTSRHTNSEITTAILTPAASPVIFALAFTLLDPP